MIRVEAFGFGRVWQGGEPIELVRRQKELFFFLLEQPGGERRDAIATALWPEEGDRELLVNRFGALVGRLRKTLGESAIVFSGKRRQPGLYRLELGIESYDVREFEEAVRAYDYEKAIRLYKGVYLPEIESDWAFWRRQELEVQYQKVLEIIDG